MASLVLQGRVEGSVIYGDVQEDIQRRHGTPLQYSCLDGGGLDLVAVGTDRHGQI